ncbi:MAG: hypothetical protein D8M55_00110 [Chloroflexi bacterium]|nr:hypothetical protein [Chloroflexota bacterium]
MSFPFITSDAAMTGSATAVVITIAVRTGKAALDGFIFLIPQLPEQLVGGASIADKQRHVSGEFIQSTDTACQCGRTHSRMGRHFPLNELGYPIGQHKVSDVRQSHKHGTCRSQGQGQSQVLPIADLRIAR